MENIYKIRIRSSPDQSNRYPSERRYSSSIVLGFSVMFLALAMTSSLMGTLVVRRLSQGYRPSSSSNSTTGPESENVPSNASAVLEDEEQLSEPSQRFLEKVEEDLRVTSGLGSQKRDPLKTHSLVSAGCFVMALGALLAGIAGIFAWKQWYIDNNITWFFLATCFSTVTSAISLLLTAMTLLDLETLPVGPSACDLTLGLSLNILITSLLGLTWSAMASKVAFRGMKSSYPDDLVLSKGRVQVSTVTKGNRNARIVPPDILNHFPTTGKLAKYFPKKEAPGHGLPKAESNREYEERVKQFLSGQGQEEETTK